MLGIGSHPAKINVDILPNGPSKLLQPLFKRCYAALTFRIALSERHEYANTINLAYPLRACRKRPRGRSTAEQLDELASPHSITSSARASSVDGMVTPSALAVTRLTTRSNLVGCSTGRSAGFAPRRILSTYSAARRFRSGKFDPYDIRPAASTYSHCECIVGRRPASAKVLMRSRCVFTNGSPIT